MRWIAWMMLLGWCTACSSGPTPKPTPAPTEPAPAAAPAPAATACDTPVPLEEVFGVWQLLSLHEMALSTENLHEITQDPVAALLFLYQHQDLKGTTRHRAFEALSFVPDPRVKALYLTQIKQQDGSPLRHKALLGFARAWPQEATEVLGGVLATDVDVQIRLTAAHALGRFCGDEGRALILQAIDIEKESWAREKMQRYANPDAARPPMPMPTPKPKPHLDPFSHHQGPAQPYRMVDGHAAQLHYHLVD